MKKATLSFGGICPFSFSIEHVRTDAESRNNTFESHIHRECEIYVNVSGDVSFVVENRIYPVVSGSTVITRPHEYHHCVYHSKELHEHFWILFSCEGNEGLLDRFFCRAPGENNLLILSPAHTEELFSLCRRLADAPDEGEGYYLFFKLLRLLNLAEATDGESFAYPKDVVQALNYLRSNFSESLSVSDLARAANVSVNTLERHFAEVLHTSPMGYLRKTRMANAAKLLLEGASVTEACLNSGFSDPSSFISLFKRTYGMTPLQYKKQTQHTHGSL